VAAQRRLGHRLGGVFEAIHPEARRELTVNSFLTRHNAGRRSGARAVVSIPRQSRGP
jgi:hypothetical protein